MLELGRRTFLRPCEPSDDPFLYDVFATTWESEVAALPNQKLAQHVLRIQHIAQERRFATRYPGHRRLVVLHGDRRAGRLYLFEAESSLHLVDLTLMPEFRCQGIGTRILHHLMAEATRDGSTISVGVPRTNKRVTGLCAALGFQLVAVDDLDNSFEWTPASIAEAAPQAPVVARVASRPGGRR
jgi:ribosomal protein S18 acetylase RimI-like enzyme